MRSLGAPVWCEKQQNDPRNMDEAQEDLAVRAQGSQAMWTDDCRACRNKSNARRRWCGRLGLQDGHKLSHHTGSWDLCSLPLRVAFAYSTRMPCDFPGHCTR